MEYEVHGRHFVHDDSECGIYKSSSPIERAEYAVMDMNLLVNAINDMPVDKAIEAVTQLRDRASQQANWQHTPHNLGFPILRQIPEPSTTIREVRDKIQNTERFCNNVLEVLKGK